MTTICQANIEVLNQLIDLIHCCDSKYSTKNGTVAGIGEHTRHILDHYRAVKFGLENNCINYNHRTRNSEEETNPFIAESNVQDLITWLTNLDASARPIQVISEISVSETQSETLESNLQRELLYLINHSIHHLAYAALAARSLGIIAPKHIGLAPGTATYQRSLKNQQEAS